MPKATTGAQVLEREPTKEEMIAEWKRSMDEGVDPFIVIPNGWDTPEDARRKAGNEMVWEAKKIRAQADAEKNAIEKQRLIDKADVLATTGRKMGGVISREIDQELTRNIVANERILDARMAWLDAQKKGDEAGKKQAEQDAGEARKLGGTIPNCDTEEMKRIVGNQMILSAKILWAEADKEHDPANKEKAEKLAAKGRSMGGTITLQDDLADAQRMVGNEMIWGAKQIWADPKQANGDANQAVASAAYAREHMGGTITIDHSIEEAERVVADNRSHTPSKYGNSKGRAWNGVFNKAEWENHAQFFYDTDRKAGGDKWANDNLFLAELILYGSPKDAEWAKNNINKVTKSSGGQGGQGNADYWRNKIVEEAKYWVGKIPYCRDTKISTMVLDKEKWPPYMDCSDFTSSVYKTILDIEIGQTTRDQKDRGVEKTYAELTQGDLILFDWDHDDVPDHVGIYISDGDFIHEVGNNTDSGNLSNPKENVKIENLNDSWGPKYGTLKNNIYKIIRIIQDNNNVINIRKNGEKPLPGYEPQQDQAVQKIESAGQNITDEDYNGVNDSTLGKKVETTAELANLEEKDILARTIFGECCSGEEDFGQESVAWTIINRKMSGAHGSTYKEVVLARGQYAAVTGAASDTGLARDPLKSSGNLSAWKKAVYISGLMLDGKTNEIPNRIGSGMYFRTSRWFEPALNPNYVRIVNGNQYQLYADKKWNNIKDIQTFGDNTYFNYGTK